MRPNQVPIYDGSKWVVGNASAPNVSSIGNVSMLEGDVTGPPRSRMLAEPRVLRPFVLKCPQCSAPLQAPTESARTRCKYCDVPLVWEPVESLSKDDRFYRMMEEALDDDEPVGATLGFGPTEVSCMSEVHLQTQASIPVRPSHLYVPPNIADSFSIVDLRVGHNSQLVSMGALPASAFSVGRGSPIACKDTATPGLVVTLVVRNESLQNLRFRAMLRCRTLDSINSSYPGYPHMVSDASPLRTAHPMDVMYGVSGRSYPVARRR